MSRLPSPRDADALGVQLGQHLADDLRGLVRRQWLAAFDLGDVGGEVLDRMDATDQDVTQGLATGFGIADPSMACSHRVWGLGHGMDERHGLLAAAGCRPGLAVGFCCSSHSPGPRRSHPLRVKDPSAPPQPRSSRRPLLLPRHGGALGAQERPGCRLHCERSSSVVSPWCTRRSAARLPYPRADPLSPMRAHADSSPNLENCDPAVRLVRGRRRQSLQGSAGFGLHTSDLRGMRGPIAAVVIDIPTEDGFVTFAAFADDTTSFYTSAGGGTWRGAFRPWPRPPESLAAAAAHVELFPEEDTGDLPWPERCGSISSRRTGIASSTCL